MRWRWFSEEDVAIMRETIVSLPLLRDGQAFSYPAIAKAVSEDEGLVLSEEGRARLERLTSTILIDLVREGVIVYVFGAKYQLQVEAPAPVVC